MKKVILIAFLILSISCSLLAGTFAKYVVSIDDVASGSVVGKNFIFLEDGEDTFEHNVKISPTETVIWEFGVKNFDGTIIAETDLYYRLSFDVKATDGKQAIAPLVVTVKDGSNNTVATQTGTGVFTINGSFPLSEIGQSAAYTFEIYWPSDNEVDIDFAGDNYGTTINVSAVASQIELDGSGEEEPGGNPGGGGEDEEPGGNPGGGEETPQSGVSILYEVTSKWIDGQNTPKHNFNITITNTTDTPINGWEISFNYPGEIVYTSDCVLVSSNPATGAYTFRNPNNYNQTINPGASVVFRGSSAVGSGSLPITAVTLNGSAVPSTAITFVSP
jgi:hypothetical protein